MRRRIARINYTAASDNWDAVIRDFERRLGGVSLHALIDGDEQAFRIATRSLRKEVIRLMTADAESKSDRIDP